MKILKDIKIFIVIALTSLTYTIIYNIKLQEYAKLFDLKYFGCLKYVAIPCMYFTGMIIICYLLKDKVTIHVSDKYLDIIFYPIFTIFFILMLARIVYFFGIFNALLPNIGFYLLWTPIASVSGIYTVPGLLVSGAIINNSKKIKQI